MRALVTGAAGFVGSHLCEQLHRRGWDVTGIDNLSTGSIANLASVLDDGGHFTLIVGDVAKVLKGWPKYDYDVVYHLAARIGPEYVVKDRFAMMREHCLDTLAAIRVAKRSNATLVFTSTSEIYGANTKEPFNVTDPTTIGPVGHPRWAYAVSKLWCEHAIIGAAEKRGLNAVIARLFNVAGPRQLADHGLVLPSFAKAALSGKPIKVHGDGSQRRCFSHVNDVVETLIWLAGKAEGQVVNVGNTNSRTILDVARDVVAQVQHEYGIDAEIELVPFAEVPDRPAAMHVRMPGDPVLRGSMLTYTPNPLSTGGTISPDIVPWKQIVVDVCAWQAATLAKEKAAA